MITDITLCLQNNNPQEAADQHIVISETTLAETKYSHHHWWHFQMLENKQEIRLTTKYTAKQQLRKSAWSKETAASMMILPQWHYSALPTHLSTDHSQYCPRVNITSLVMSGTGNKWCITITPTSSLSVKIFYMHQIKTALFRLLQF